MRNPLTKRIPRELAKDAAKYIAIFIMMVLLISMCSGMRVGNESLKKAYYDSFEIYNIEDGHIVFDKQLPESLKNTLEEKIGMKLYDGYYFDETMSETGADIRVYKQTSEVNKPCLLSGELPAADNEIAIDRVFAKNNNINVGDKMTLNGKKLTVTGFVALPNYSTLYENNTDAMFDSINFSIAVMTDSGFESVGSKNLSYNYAWQYNKEYKDDIEAAELSEKFLDVIEDELTDYDEAIVEKQVDEITDKLEKASEEYADIYKKRFEDKIEEVTETVKTGAEEYGELYKSALEEKISSVAENVQKGAEEYAALLMTGNQPTKADLSVDVDDFAFQMIENSVQAAMSGTEYTAPSEQEFLAQYKDSVKKPTQADLSVETDDFTFKMIEDTVSAMLSGEEPSAPSEDDFKDAYLKTIEKPTKDELSVPLDDFLFGIIEDGVDAEINGEEYEMPADEEFEDEIDKTDIISVDDYVPRYLNMAVTFSIDDIGGDEAGTMVMVYMMIALIAFIFAVTISNTVVSEAGVIGTLRASGYTKGEMIRHYMALPIIVTFIAAVVGNIIGYTVMKDFCVDLYLGSYSLTTYTTVWDASAFILSTVVPIVLMLIINFAVLISKLKLSPLKFLRRDLRKNNNKKAFRLNTKIPFKTRFSLRILLTNLPGYIIMIIGILFSSILISFGDMMPRMMTDYKEIVIRDMISEYQYIVYDYEEAGEVSDEQAEKFAMSSFDYSKEGFLTDSISVYGVSENSRYVSANIPEGTALISTGISEKYGLSEGDIITLDEKYKRDSSYEIKIGGVYDYESSLAMFMNLDDYNSTFGNDKDYFTGYFSNKELTELDPDDVASVITASDYTKLSDQLMTSMGGMMGLFKWFGALFFIIVIYVLCKQVIERNFQSIALTKILGFRNSEIAGLYIVSTSIAVLVGLLISIPFIDVAMRAIFTGYLYTVMTGYIPCIISPITYIVTFVTGVACYAAVALLQMRKVAKVSKSEALKNVE